MQLQTVQLSNFKNYADLKLDLSAKINVFVGKNGSGKTNLLDAIHYLSLTKSAFSADNFCVRQGEQFFFIKGLFRHQSNLQDLSCSFQAGSKKVFREGVNEYQKLSDHIGKYPVVLIAPDDTALVKEGSEDRRKFFDAIISQLDRVYLNALIQYTNALKQRNSLLKIFAETKTFDSVALESYNYVLGQSGSVLFAKRKSFISEFLPYFKEYYNFIVAKEETDLEYRSDLNTIDFETGLRENLQRDRLLQRTNFGVHRDDYLFTLGKGELKRLGSQGQQKSFIIALKLAQFEIIKRNKGFSPILLLDDIFDKLDDLRIAKLLELIQQNRLGQLFITDARPDRTAQLLESAHIEAAVSQVDSGNVTRL